MPEDWQGENGETESVSATVPSLEGKEGTGTDAVTTVTMKNQRTGEITLTKSLVTINDATGEKETGKANDAANKFQFKLYQKTEDGELQPYTTTEHPDGTYTTDVNGQIHITDLPGVNSEGELISYYLVEETEPGFEMETSAKTEELTIDDKQVKALGPIKFDTSVFTRELEVTNVEQQLTLRINKQDAYTHEFVPGVHVKIEKLTDDNSTYEEVASDVEIKEGGYTLAVNPGEHYKITETTIPSGYKPKEEDTAWEVTIPGETVTSSTEEVGVTLENIPDPKIQITKQLVNASGGTRSGNAVFEIYQKVSEGRFTAVADGMALL